MKLIIRPCVLFTVSLMAFLVLGAGAPGAEPDAVDIKDMLKRLGFNASDEQKLLSGEFLSNDPGESTDKELAVTILAFMPAAVSEVVAMVKEHKVYETDATILQYGNFSKTPSAMDLEKLSYTGDELKDWSDLLDSKPGSDFNLSQQEWDVVKGLRKTLGRKNPESDPQAAAMVMDAYRGFMLKRAQDYLGGGLNSIASYQRKGNNQDFPGRELAAALQSDFVKINRGKNFLKALQDFPKSQYEGLESQMFWIKQAVEKRPCVALVHNLIESNPDYAYMAQRQIFVGNNYNSLQILVGCFPVEKGTVIFYRNRTSTDQVAGFGSSMRHKIGRGMMRDTILERFAKVQSHFKK